MAKNAKKVLFPKTLLVTREQDSWFAVEDIEGLDDEKNGTKVAVYQLVEVKTFRKQLTLDLE